MEREVAPASFQGSVRKLLYRDVWLDGGEPLQIVGYASGGVAAVQNRTSGEPVSWVAVGDLRFDPPDCPEQPRPAPRGGRWDRTMLLVAAALLLGTTAVVTILCP